MDTTLSFLVKNGSFNSSSSNSNMTFPLLQNKEGNSFQLRNTLIGVVGVLFNALAIVFLSMNRKLKFSLKLSLLSLSFNDFIFMIAAVIWGCQKTNLTSDNSICWPILYFVSTSLIVSYLNTVLIATQNFVAVFLPIRCDSIITDVRISVAVGGVWVVSYAMSLALNGIEQPKGLACFVLVVLSKQSVGILCILFLLCCVSVCVMNFKIFSKVRNRRVTVQNEDNPRDRNSALCVGISSENNIQLSATTSSIDSRRSAHSNSSPSKYVSKYIRGSKYKHCNDGSLYNSSEKSKNPTVSEHRNVSSQTRSPVLERSTPVVLPTISSTSLEDMSYSFPRFLNSDSRSLDTRSCSVSSVSDQNSFLKKEQFYLNQSIAAADSNTCITPGCKSEHSDHCSADTLFLQKGSASVNIYLKTPFQCQKELFDTHVTSSRDTRKMQVLCTKASTAESPIHSEDGNTARARKDASLLTKNVKVMSVSSSQLKEKGLSRSQMKRPILPQDLEEVEELCSRHTSSEGDINEQEPKISSTVTSDQLCRNVHEVSNFIPNLEIKQTVNKGLGIISRSKTGGEGIGPASDCAPITPTMKQSRLNSQTFRTTNNTQSAFSSGLNVSGSVEKSPTKRHKPSTSKDLTPSLEQRARVQSSSVKKREVWSSFPRGNPMSRNHRSRVRIRNTLTILTFWCCFLTLPYVIFMGYLVIWSGDRTEFSFSKIGVLASSVVGINALTNPLLYAWRFIKWKAFYTKIKARLR